MSFPFRQVVLVGFGLMGGSLAKALKALSDPPWISGFSADPEEIRMGLEEELLDQEAVLDGPALQETDLLVYATPPAATLELITAHAPLLSDRTTITDVVSLNTPILLQAKEVGLEKQFVTSHPLAGGTGTGFREARDGLFRGATVWISPGEAEGKRVLQVEDLWKGVGAEPKRIHAEAHDRLMAWVSHLPQLAGNALAEALLEAGIHHSSLGPGGRDATRLAGSGAEMWSQLLEFKSEALLEGLESVEKALARIRHQLSEGRMEEVEALMLRTRRWTEAEE